MTSLSALWMPIVLAAVLVFVMSSLIHMVMPWHKNDYPGVPDEKGVMDALRPFAIPPGNYMVPRPGSMADMKSAAYLEKLNKGPVLWMTMRPNGYPGMGRELGLWFCYTIVIGIFAGYVAGAALGPGATYLQVFRFAGVTAFAAYGLALPQLAIWYHRGWRVTLASMFDALIYAGLTAGAFGWLWPK